MTSARSLPGGGPSSLRFECTRCGDCCRIRGQYAYVYLNTAEIRALADHLGLGVRPFKRRYTFVDEDGWRQLRFTGDACVFLDRRTSRCTVYDARPTQCRTFPFWRELVRDGEWTAEARRLCEGVGRGRLYSILDAESRMAEQELSDLP